MSAFLRGVKSTRTKSTQNKKFIWTSFSARSPLGSWLVSQGRRQKLARTFRKSSCKRVFFWYFGILGAFVGLYFPKDPVILKILRSYFWTKQQDQTLTQRCLVNQKMPCSDGMLDVAGGKPCLGGSARKVEDSVHPYCPLLSWDVCVQTVLQTVSHSHTTLVQETCRLTNGSFWSNLCSKV